MKGLFRKQLDIPSEEEEETESIPEATPPLYGHMTILQRKKDPTPRKEERERMEHHAVCCGVYRKMATCNYIPILTECPTCRSKQSYEREWKGEK